MKIEKIDPARFEEWEFDLIDDGGIEVAFQLRPEPVYFVMRHGRRKKCFSRSAAINNLAHFMTQKVFDRARKASSRPNYKVIIDDATGDTAWKKGETLPVYWDCHSRALRRIHRLLARRREILKQEAKKKKLTDLAIDEYRRAIDKIAELRLKILELNN